MSRGHLQPDALAAVAGGAEDQLGRNDPVLEDQPLVIDVVNEEVERANPLLEPALDPVPLGGGDQPGDRVERDDPLDALLAAVDRERDPLLAHRQVGHLVAPLELVGAELDQPLVEGRVVRPRGARAIRTSRRRRSGYNGRTERPRRDVVLHASSGT